MTEEQTTDLAKAFEENHLMKLYCPAAVNDRQIGKKQRKIDFHGNNVLDFFLHLLFIATFIYFQCSMRSKMFSKR